MKYRFVDYWKYEFTLELEDGTKIHNKEQTGDDIYRLSITKEGEAEKQEDGTWLVSGYSFVSYPHP